MHWTQHGQSTDLDEGVQANLGRVHPEGVQHVIAVWKKMGGKKTK